MIDSAMDMDGNWDKGIPGTASKNEFAGHGTLGIYFFCFAKGLACF